MQHSYFELRRVSAEDYASFKLPGYLPKVLPKDRGARILDFGCGLGQMLKALSSAGYSNLVGLDVDEAALSECRAAGFTVFHGRQELTELEGTCEIVVMSHVLEHFPKDQIIPTLERVRRFLSPTGRLVVMVPNAQANTGCYWAYEDFTHHTLFTSGSLYYVLRAAGFQTVEFIDINCLETVRSLPLRLLRKLLLTVYRANYHFWNRITSSPIHKQSPAIFSYEIKAVAK